MPHITIDKSAQTLNAVVGLTEEQFEVFNKKIGETIQKAVDTASSNENQPGVSIIEIIEDFNGNMSTTELVLLSGLYSVEVMQKFDLQRKVDEQHKLITTILSFMKDDDKSEIAEEIQEEI